MFYDLGEILWTQSESCSWTFFSMHLASKRNGRGWILMSFWINEGEDGISCSRRLRAALKWWNSTLLFSWIAQKFTGKFTQINNPSPANVILTESVNSSFTSVLCVLFKEIRYTEMLSVICKSNPDGVMAWHMFYLCWNSIMPSNPFGIKTSVW